MKEFRTIIAKIFTVHSTLLSILFLWQIINIIYTIKIYIHKKFFFKCITDIKTLYNTIDK